MDANNGWLEDVDQIGQTFVSYFKELFTTSRPKVKQEMIDAIHSKVTERMNSTLTQDFHAIEVEKALKQMHPLTAPGPNDMPLYSTSTFGLLLNLLSFTLLWIF